MPQIVVTLGEPAGIGPDIVLQLAEKNQFSDSIVVGDPDLLLSRATLLGIKVKLAETDLNHPLSANAINILPVKLKETVIPGKLNVANAPYVLKCLEIATDLCLQKKADALVTGPIQKNILNEAGIAFHGHTEFLQAHCNADDVLMLFVINNIRIALATTHIPLKEVPDAITLELLIKKCQLLHQGLKDLFGIKSPHILLSGLNPHAGESGYLGREELDTIIPAIKALSSKHINVDGPYSADTLFTDKFLQNADGILAMYHDQALPVVKYMGFYDAVNVTLGLPIIRTSVDHGTALDIAGTGKTNPGSLLNALQLAVELAEKKHI